MADPQQQPQLTLEQFGQKIKSKYPQYQSLSDTDIANKVLAKYPQYKSSVRQNGGASGSWEPAPLRERLTEIQKPDRNAPAGKEALKAIGNVGAGAIAPILHPVDTLAGIGGIVTAPFEMAAGRSFSSTIPGQMVQQFKENPLGTIEAGIGGAATAEAVGEVAPRLIPKSGVSRSVTDLVSKTKGENEAAAAKAQADYTKATEAHKAEAAEAAHETQGRELAHKQKVEVKASELRAQRIKANREAEQAHTKTVDETKAANAAATKTQAKIPATREKLGNASQELQAQIETARNNALKVGNEKFNGVNEKLNDLPVDSDTIHNGLIDALGKIKGTETEPPILKGLAKRIEQGDVLTYRDLQGYYTELNAELSKGTLPGDIYQAYDTLHETVGDDMQRIADSQDAGAELKDARSYWHRMKQTFGKPYNPNDVANVVREKATGKLAADEEQANRVRLLGSFDKGIPSTVEHIGNLRQGLESLPKEQPVRDVVKPLPSKPTPLSTATAGTEASRAVPLPERVVPSDRPEMGIAPKKTISTEDIQGAKKSEYDKRVGDVTRYGHKMSVVLPLLYMAHDIVKLNLPNIPEAAAGAGIGYAGTTALTNLLQRPAVVEFFTKATAQDIAQIPADLRGDLPQMVSAAERQGVRVSPALKGLTGTAMGIAPRKQPSDEYAGH